MQRQQNEPGRRSMRATRVITAWLAVAGCALLSLNGCWRSAGPEVVAYVALDSEFSAPILAEFSQETGIQALPKFDIESTKTVGLTEALIAERDRPRCDVFWNNEILHTLRLEKLGLLEPYVSPAAADFPAMYRSPRGMWYGFAARARILIVNTEKIPPDRRPKSIHDLVAPEWQGQVGLAKPLFGTTATHAACLFAVWGDDKARAYFDRLKQSAKIVGGNKQVAEAVASGQLAFGLTDTDDAMVEVEKGMPVEIIYPDQEADGLGTLFIPNTVSILRGAPTRQPRAGWWIICWGPASRRSWPRVPAPRFRSTRRCTPRRGSRRRPRSTACRSTSPRPVICGPRCRATWPNNSPSIEIVLAGARREGIVHRFRRWHRLPRRSRDPGGPRRSSRSSLPREADSGRLKSAQSVKSVDGYPVGPTELAIWPAPPGTGASWCAEKARGPKRPARP